MRTYTEEKRIRPDILTAAVFWSVIIMMLYNIISVRIFGDTGSGFSAGPLTLYFLLYVSFVLAVQKAVYIMVRPIRTGLLRYLFLLEFCYLCLSCPAVMLLQGIFLLQVRFILILS